MRDLIVYPDDYIIDEESEVLVHGFYVKIEGEGLFKEENHKIRCLRCIKRHIALKGIEVYAIKCTDNFLLLMVGNCTYCDIQQALRIFYSSYLVFYEKTFNSDCNHKTSIRFIKSTLDFKRTFFKVTIINQNDFTDCITNPWSSFNYYLTDKWEYGNIISKDKAYKAFGGNKDPYIFALEVFDPSYVDFKNYINGEYLKKIYSAQYQNLEQHKIEFTINRSLSDFYGYPIDFFYLFPRMKHIMIVRALKNKKLIGCIIFNLINKGFSFRKSAEQLGCSHSKLYQLYNEYIKEIMKKDKKQEETCENNDT